MVAGFSGTVRSRREIAPTGGRLLRLPQDGIREGAALRLPPGSFDAVIVDGITESMGDLGRFAQAVAAALLPGGEVLVDAANLQSPAQLHRVLEGRPGSFEPAGTPRERERPILPRDLLEALAAAGLLVVDRFAVPPGLETVPEGFAARMVEAGFLAAPWVGAQPAARLWVLGRRAAPLAGSVLIGSGPDAARRRTADAVRAFVPDDWEVIACPGDGELASFNHGVRASSGELLWLLPAGATPEAALFARLVGQTLTAPAVPQEAEDVPGGLCGLMLPRLALLLAGPFRLDWQCEQVASEELGLRLAALVSAPVAVPGRLRPPARPRPDAALLAREAAALTSAWEPILSRPFRGERLPAAPTAQRATAPWAGRAPRISLCMIARDEERFLAGCLESARAAADEIVLVDTGSRDRTREIARGFDARVVEAAWEDDFAAARNRGLELASGDWILVLDADERLEPGAAARLRELAQDAGVSGFHMIMRNLYGGGRTQGVRMVRMFRRLPGVRFENRIHEQVTPSLTAAAAPLGLVLSSCDVVIEHHGYRDEVIAERGKDARNERLFEKQLADHPDDVYTLYKYGDFLRRLPGRTDDALRALQRALRLVLEMPPHDQLALPYAGEIAALCALELGRQDRLDEADAVVEQALRQFLPTPNLHYIAAGLCARSERSDEAIAHYRCCLGYAGRVMVVPIQEGITGHVAITGIAQAWMQKGDLVRGRRLLAQSLALCPTYEVTALALSRLEFECGDYAASLQVLTDFLAAQPESAGACQQATLILDRLGMAEQARAMGKRAVTLLERAARPAEARRMHETVAAMSQAEE